jgi:Protein of unknown function (DUF4232)
MKKVQATLAATVWAAAAVAAVGCPAPAHADPPVGGCDPEALTVTAGRMQSGLGHRAIQLNFALQPGAGSCQLSGYPTVDAFVETGVLADGAAPIHAEQTPSGYMAAPVPVTTVTLDPDHDAHATLEWVGNFPRPDCSTYPGPRTDARLQVTPPGMSQTLTVPISIGRNEGLCGLEVHPLTA